MPCLPNILYNILSSPHHTTTHHISIRSLAPDPTHGSIQYIVRLYCVVCHKTLTNISMHYVTQFLLLFVRVWYPTGAGQGLPLIFPHFFILLYREVTGNHGGGLHTEACPCPPLHCKTIDHPRECIS